MQSLEVRYDRGACCRAINQIVNGIIGDPIERRRVAMVRDDHFHEPCQFFALQCRQNLCRSTRWARDIEDNNVRVMLVNKVNALGPVVGQPYLAALALQGILPAVPDEVGPSGENDALKHDDFDL